MPGACDHWWTSQWAPKVISTEPANEPASAPADPRQFRGSRGGNNPPGPAGAPAPSPAATRRTRKIFVVLLEVWVVSLCQKPCSQKLSHRSMELPKEQSSDAKPGSLFLMRLA